MFWDGFWGGCEVLFLNFNNVFFGPILISNSYKYLIISILLQDQILGQDWRFQDLFWSEKSENRSLCYDEELLSPWTWRFIQFSWTWSIRIWKCTHRCCLILWCIECPCFVYPCLVVIIIYIVFFIHFPGPGVSTFSLGKRESLSTFLHPELGYFEL